MVDIDIVKQKLKEISILKVADELGISHKGKSARCFMHNDKKPSLGFNTSKNTWKCYACNKGGDQVTLVMEKLNLSYINAYKWLANRFNIIISENNGCRKNMKTRMFSPKIIQSKPKEIQNYIDGEIISWIVNNARLSKAAKEFLYNQRKYKPEVVETLKIGSISEPRKLITALVNIFGLERSLKSKIVCRNQSNLYLFFRTPCLIFPYTDVDGNIMNIQTRYIGTDKKAPRFQFLPGTVAGMFNISILNHLSVDEKLFISEGITDCIALLSSGRKSIAIPSATLLHDSDVKLLISKNLFMYPDNDNAGKFLYDNLSKKLDAFGSMIMYLQLPEDCKDFSDYYLKLISENG